MILFISNPIGIAVATITGFVVGAKALFEYNKQVSSLNKELKAFGINKQEIDAVRENVSAISETYNKEFSEVALSVNSLSKSFGISFSEAGRLVSEGLAKGGQFNKEFLESLGEYDEFFAKAGFSAENFINIINAGFDLGIYKDKFPDAIKELNLSLEEGTKASRDALIYAFGTEFADKVLNGVKSGVLSTKQAFDLISEQTLKYGLDTQQIAKLNADVFRGAGEDAGGLLQIINAVNLANQKQRQGLSESEKVQEEYRQSLEDLGNAQFKLFGIRGLDEVWLKIKSTSLSTLTDWLNRMNSFITSVKNAITIVKSEISNIINSIKGVFKSLVNFDFSGVGKNLVSIFKSQYQVIKTLTLNFVAGLVDALTFGFTSKFTNNLRKIASDSDVIRKQELDKNKKFLEAQNKQTKDYKDAQEKALKSGQDSFVAKKDGRLRVFDAQTGKEKINKTKTKNEEQVLAETRQTKEDKTTAPKESKLDKITKANPLENAKLEIEAQRLALEYKIQSYKQEENLAENNLTFLEMVRQEKLRLLKEEKDIELQKEGITAQEKKNINAKYQIDVLNINRQAQEDKKSLELEAKNLELETFKVRNASVLENAKTLTQELVRLENERINKIIELEKNKLAIQYQINKKQLDDKIATNQKLTENEQKYYNEILQIEKDKIQQQYENNIKLNESLINNQKNQIARENQLLDEKYKATDDFKIKDLERKAEIEKEDLANKQTAEIEKLQLQNEAKLLTDEDFLIKKAEIENYYKEEQNTIDEEENALKNEIFENNLLNQAELLGQSFEKGNEMRAVASSVWQFFDEQDKRSNAQKTADVLGATADLFGRQTALGKAFAVGQATINTLQAFTNALALTPLPPPGPQIAAGLTLAAGLAQVAKIVSYKPPKYADGTLNAPNTEIAITDEEGAELHFDSNFRLKDFGSNKGARLKEVKKGDKIIPADITSMIMKGNLNEIKPKNQNFDLDKLANKIANSLNKRTNKHYLVVNGNIVKVVENEKEEHFIYPNNRSFFKQELF